MQPRLNIAIKACRAASEIINKIYKSKDQDDLRSYDDITPVDNQYDHDSTNNLLNNWKRNDN